ncbi:MAG: DUF4281 domain-containing protein [Rhizobiaceae bacterium]|nr:DUF4281 domain-containing protein [Rhizobiaceae bacterium]MCV0406940.1 DUF4281 domain-containing protein [Rhizobiaceae bacterium]
MTPDSLFQLANMSVLVGWASLLAGPWLPRLADRVASIVVPALLSVAYAGLILAFWSRAEGGFDTLANVAALFETRELLLAGWLHYLAFDLFVGAWEVRTAREERVPFLIVLPCLPLTFLFGPAGFLAFIVLREAHRRVRAASYA